MGMDVYGIDPVINAKSVKPPQINFMEASEDERMSYFDANAKYESENPGIYFRANVWSWRPLHMLIIQFCQDYLKETGQILIEDPVLESMGMNDGDGPQEEWQCKELAKRFDVWLEHNAKGHTVDLGMRVEAGGKFTDSKDPETTFSAHSIHDEHIKEFVKFLENCGGFQVC